jgi:CTP synthase (UTP-ammonia lyase)
VGKINQTVSVGIIADFDSNRPSHKATNEAIHHAADYLSLEVDVTWLPTPSFLTPAGQKRLEQFDAIWAGPGGPYQSRDGAIMAIRLTREMKRPFIGT